MSNIKVELVTPDALLYASNAGYVSLPAKEGEMGVLVDHAPMVVSLGGGLLNIYNDINAEPVASFFIYGGIAQVTEKVCTILADEAIDIKTADIEKAKIRLNIAEENFNKNSESLQSIEFQEKVNSAQKLIDLIQNK